MSTENSEKPLDKMTVKELRDVAKEIPEITGVHGKNKAELLAVIKEAKGIQEKPKKSDRSVRALKQAIRALRQQQAQADRQDQQRVQDSLAHFDSGDRRTILTEKLGTQDQISKNEMLVQLRRSRLPRPGVRGSPLCWVAKGLSPGSTRACRLGG